MLTALLAVSPSTVEVNQPVTFDGCHSFAADGDNIVAYTFDPKDGTTPVRKLVTNEVTCGPGHADASVFVRSYAQAGNYQPTLTVEDNRGVIKSMQAGVKVAPAVPAQTRRGGGALGWLTLLPLLAAGLGRRRRRH